MLGVPRAIGQAAVEAEGVVKIEIEAVTMARARAYKDCDTSISMSQWIAALPSRAARMIRVSFCAMLQSSAAVGARKQPPARNPR